MFSKIFRSRFSTKTVANLEKTPSSSSSTQTQDRPPQNQREKAQSFPVRTSTGKKKPSAEDGPRKSSSQKHSLPFPTYNLSISGSTEPIIFRDEELQAMTANWRTVVGKGGFGTVFKGHIINSSTAKKVAVAVKVLHSAEQGLEEDLMREIVAVAKLQHENILRLIGYCNTDDTKAFVYDYMGAGDVDELLRKCRKGGRSFSWEERVEVALGCARALAFMHEQSCVHRDFKSSNVLLTDDLSPRVADFGLVKFIQDWNSHCTTKVKGSIGYIDPMYFTIGHVHTKSDVYAFGVFLVELITGKSVYQDQVHETIIPDLTAGKVTEAVVKQILDPTLPQDKVTIQRAKTLAELARRSLQDHWESRPNMKDLIQKISRLKKESAADSTQ